MTVDPDHTPAVPGDACTMCGGTGQVGNAERCPLCDGTGKIDPSLPGGRSDAPPRDG